MDRNLRGALEVLLAIGPSAGWEKFRFQRLFFRKTKKLPLCRLGQRGSGDPMCYFSISSISDFGTTPMDLFAT